jgi:hypothetical protein
MRCKLALNLALLDTEEEQVTFRIIHPEDLNLQCGLSPEPQILQQNEVPLQSQYQICSFYPHKIRINTVLSSWKPVEPKIFIQDLLTRKKKLGSELHIPNVCLY